MLLQKVFIDLFLHRNSKINIKTGIAEQLTKNIKRLDRNHATGVASHITLETPLVHEGDIESHADRFFSEYPFFGVHEFKNELKLTTKQKDPHFAKRFSAVFEQHHKGLRVFGSQIRLHFNDDHYITGADGTFIADLHNLNTDISIDQATATEIAKNHFKEKYDVNDFVVGDVELMVYREGINSGRKGDNYVAWMCVVSDQQMRRDRIFVNAKSGEVIVVIPLVHSIRREVFFLFIKLILIVINEIKGVGRSLFGWISILGRRRRFSHQQHRCKFEFECFSRCLHRFPERF